MARQVFYSFHYKPDCVRASQVRNIGVVEGNAPAKDNDWETVTSGGDAAIQKWINEQMKGRSCAVILVGAETAGRKWINYEIEKAWKDGKGVVGVHIHNLKDFSGNQSTKGANPFAGYTLNEGKEKFEDVVKCYNPPYTDSKQVYAHISENIADWIEGAIKIRAKYP